MKGGRFFSPDGVKMPAPFSLGNSVWSTPRAWGMLRDFGALQGRALGERKPIGKSREGRRPAGASRIAGIEFTINDAVATSPGAPPGITMLTYARPLIE